MTIRPGRETIAISPESAWAVGWWSGVALIFLPTHREAGVGTVSYGDRLPGLQWAGSLSPLLISAATFAGMQDIVREGAWLRQVVSDAIAP